MGFAGTCCRERLLPPPSLHLPVDVSEGPVSVEIVGEAVLRGFPLRIW